MTQAYLAKEIKRVSIIDLCLVGPMAVPGVSHAIIDLIAMIDHALGLHSEVGEMNAVGMMFMNVVGVLAIVWSVARIKAPAEHLAWLDIYARLAVAFILAFYSFVSGMSVVFAFFMATELIGAVWQMRATQMLDSPPKPAE